MNVMDWPQLLVYCILDMTDMPECLVELFWIFLVKNCSFTDTKKQEHTNATENNTYRRTKFSRAVEKKYLCRSALHSCFKTCILALLVFTEVTRHATSKRTARLNPHSTEYPFNVLIIFTGANYSIASKHVEQITIGLYYNMRKESRSQYTFFITVI